MFISELLTTKDEYRILKHEIIPLENKVTHCLITRIHPNICVTHPFIIVRTSQIIYTNTQMCVCVVGEVLHPITSMAMVIKITWDPTKPEGKYCNNL